MFAKLPGYHFDRRINALSIPESRVAKPLHRVGTRSAIRPEAETDRAVALESPVGVGADAALARTAATLVDVDTVSAVARKLVAGIADASKNEKKCLTLSKLFWNIGRNIPLKI